MNRLKCIISISAVFFFLSHSAYSQSNQPVFLQLTTNDGLSFNSVYSIVQDKQGFMWFGTFNGIDRYDGIEIKSYRNKGYKGLQMVLCMTVDSLGCLWHGSHLFKYNPQTDKKQANYFYIDSTPQLAGWFNDMIIGPDQNLYLAGNNRVYAGDMYSSDSVVREILFVEEYYNLKDLTKIRFDNNGNMWIGTDKGLLTYDFSNSKLVPFDRINYPIQRYIKDFLFSEKGDLWIAFNNQVTEYNFFQDKSVEYTIPGKSNPVLTSIFQSRNGTIWVGTTEEGLFYLNNNTHQFTCLLDQKSISALYEDRSGRLWIGTENAGILVYDSLRNFFSQLPVTISHRVISSFHSNQVEKSGKEGLWIGAMSYGLLYYDLITRETILVDPENNQINMLFEDEEGKVWYDHLDYLVCYDPENRTIKKVKHPVPEQLPSMNYGNKLTCMLAFQDRFILSSDHGLVYSYDPVTGKFDLIFENEGPIREIITKNDILYIAAYYTGVVIMDRYFTIIDTIFHNKPDESLATYAIFKLHFDRYDTLWIGGFGGVGKYNPQTKMIETKFDLTDPMDYITGMLEDSLGNLWICSSMGLYKYNRIKGHLQFFGSNHGLPTGRLFSGSAVMAKDGRMFFGGNNGIVQFNPYLVKTNPESPRWFLPISSLIPVPRRIRKTEICFWRKVSISQRKST